MKKLPGSQRQRQRAKRLLSCKHISEGFWRVWGGVDEHIVKEGKPYLCDCKIIMEKQSDICSHIIRVMIEKGAL